MTPWVGRLLFLNVVVFLLQMIRPVITNEMALIPALMFTRPWTLITYMFVHAPGSFSHIGFNMLALYFFGPRVEMRLGERRFITMYLIAGITGGVLSLFFTPFVHIVGASGAVFGVQLAFARYWPRERIMIWGVLPIEARILVIITTVMALFGGFSGGGGIAHFAHLGGYLGAWLYLKFIEARAPSKQWEAKVKGPAPSTVVVGDWRRIDLARVHEVNRDEVARLLTKIDKEGLGSLSTQERTFLQHFVPRET